jgi:hypothetical protein
MVATCPMHRSQPILLAGCLVTMRAPTVAPTTTATVRIGKPSLSVATEMGAMPSARTTMTTCATAPAQATPVRTQAMRPRVLT